MYKNTQEVKFGEYRQPLAKQLMLYQIQTDITLRIHVLVSIIIEKNIWELKKKKSILT